jgi:branched-chain amino acid transport system permease protein
MSLLLSAAVSGVALGLLYGLIGFAIVMLYKSTGVANFAQGTLATLGAFVAFTFVRDLGLPLPIAILLSLLISAAIGVISFFIVIRPRAEAGNLNITVRTLGLSLLLLAAMEWQWGAQAPYRFPSVVEGGGIEIANVVLPGQTLLVGAVSALIAAALWAFFRFTNAGLSLRALAEQAETARLLGLRSSRLGAMTWAISCVLGTIVAVLLAPSAFLLPSMMDSYIMFVFTGIVLGGLTSLPGALLGCVIVGVISNVTIVAFNFELSVVAIFVLMLVGMLLKPQGLLGKPDAVRL